jgi:hypothetical protein
MKHMIHLPALIFTSLGLLCGLSFDYASENDLKGSWVRTDDKLRIEVKAQDQNSMYSFITAEGNEKFPCEVSTLPIYKNITPSGKNSWRCDFLVVAIERCTTAYEEGHIHITKKGEMEIICPGFAKKTYTRVKPRYETD